MLEFLELIIFHRYIPIAGICKFPNNEENMVVVLTEEAKEKSMRAGEKIRLGDIVYKCPKCKLLYQLRPTTLIYRWKNICTLHKK